MTAFPPAIAFIIFAVMPCTSMAPAAMERTPFHIQQSNTGLLFKTAQTPVFPPTATIASPHRLMALKRFAIRAQPNQSGEILGTALVNDILYVGAESTDGKWTHIIIPPRLRGWASSENLQNATARLPKRK
jgi:hypothetical protein